MHLRRWLAYLLHIIRKHTIFVISYNCIVLTLCQKKAVFCTFAARSTCSHLYSVVLRVTSDVVFAAKPYSTMDELCCSGVVSWKPRNGKCCGKKAYNALTETCCDGVVQKRPTNAACCSKEAYDSLLFVCCGGKVQERPVNAFG